MKTLFTTALLSLMMTTSATHAQEDIAFPMKAPCAPVEQLLRGLEKFGEQGFASASAKVLSSKNGMEYEGDLHIYVNRENMEYTVWVTFNDGSGLACILAVGEGFGPFVAPRVEDNPTREEKKELNL